MKKAYQRRLILICAVSLLLQVCSAGIRAQEPQRQTPQEQADDVVRISTELVQTDVTVLDRQGRFVDGLKKEDFELKVDGKPVEVSFFERVAAGSLNEEAQLAAARGGSRVKVGETTGTKPLDRGRIVAFFIDDMHMAFDSLKRAKEAVTRYIDKEMGQNDLVAITSASGQIGFLQQYTDNKEVLRAALARISYRNLDPRDVERPPMSIYNALLIDRGDPAVSTYFIDETMRQNPGMGFPTAQAIVKGRANVLLQQMERTNRATLSTLEGVARSASGLAGRKLIFFISDGIFLDARNGSTLERVRNIVDASARSGVVIYSMDAKGLATGLPEAASDVPFDPSGRMQQAAGAEIAASQDVMNALAVDTGGRLIYNTNTIETGMTRALKETSLYYLLAWRPTGEEGRGKKFHRVEVGVRNRPELSVRVQRGYFDNTPEKRQTEKASAKTSTPVDPLRKALNSLFPQHGLPTRLALSYMDVPVTGSTLVASMKIEGGALKFQQTDGKAAAVVVIAGAIIDSQGKSMGQFRERVTVTPNAQTTEGNLPDIVYNYRATLKPGLYQVRVAARDEASGQTGSATQWVEIPDLSRQHLALSSLIVGERRPYAEPEEKRAESLTQGVNVSVDHSFERSSSLRFLVYIYNAARAANASAQPDVALQVQIFRDDQPVVTTPLRRVSTESQDLARLAYAAEIPLQEMSAGQYVLQVTAIDRIAKTSASQRLRFEVQ
ncbi:MAG TPA: VWA domain-containing protein [Pyrinomonadaceae bacterium]|jgi:VWFA-related protein